MTYNINMVFIELLGLVPYDVDSPECEKIRSTQGRGGAYSCGVYQVALSHMREACALDPDSTVDLTKSIARFCGEMGFHPRRWHCHLRRCLEETTKRRWPSDEELRERKERAELLTLREWIVENGLSVAVCTTPAPKEKEEEPMFYRGRGEMRLT